jgi:hypothetical protein
MTVWTEIVSIIKGGPYSDNNYFGYLKSKDYCTKYASSFLSYKDAKLVYFIFMMYENWKT